MTGAQGHGSGGKPRVEAGMAARSQPLLGSVIEIKLPQAHSPLFPVCFDELTRLEAQYTRFKETSELSRLNAHLGVWQDASDELIMLVEKGEEFRKQTDGYFDITVKARLEQLGYGPQPKKEEPLAADPLARSSNPLSLLSFLGPHIRMDRKGGRIWLGKQIEFGGLGKGYALDLVAGLLEKNRVSHYFINAGGDVYARRGQLEKGGATGSRRGGAGAVGEPWTVLLEHPDDSTRAIGSMELDGMALAASAPNRRKWGAVGTPQERHHLLNPKTGEPVKGVKAVFVLAKTGMEADAYAKGLFCGGFENGIKMSARLPVQALMISSENKVYQTPGFNVRLFE